MFASYEASGLLSSSASGLQGVLGLQALLGGSWGVISGVISKVTIVITHIRGRITPLITTHGPPSRALRLWGFKA